MPEEAGGYGFGAVGECEFADRNAAATAAIIAARSGAAVGVGYA